MADLGFHFDATKVEPTSVMEVIPEGKYTVVIVDSSIRSTKKNEANKMLQLTFQVADGKYKGSKLYAFLNIIHSNSTAVEIAKRDLSAIAHAVGVLKLKDSASLHNIPLTVHVKLEKDQNDNMRNVIKGYDKRELPSITPTATASVDVKPIPMTAQEEVETAPWAK